MYSRLIFSILDIFNSQISETGIYLVVRGIYKSGQNIKLKLTNLFPNFQETMLPNVVSFSKINYVLKFI